MVALNVVYIEDNEIVVNKCKNTKELQKYVENLITNLGIELSQILIFEGDIRILEPVEKTTYTFEPVKFEKEEKGGNDGD